MSLGTRLKNEREKRNWSQITVAKKIGITNAVLSNYERDYRDPDTETLTRLANLYEVSTDYLLGKSDNPSLTEKDEQDIAKRMEQIRRDLIEGNVNGDGLSFKGDPMSKEAMESLLESLEILERQTTLINKKYIPKKHRKNQ